ncbi:MAG: hypothetical protein ACKO23_07235, partial [Gemmataceae bacterium]
MGGTQNDVVAAGRAGNGHDDHHLDRSKDAHMSPGMLESARVLLCRLQDFIRDRVLEERARTTTEDLCRVATVTQADTIYHIDRIGEQAIVDWFTANWPADHPVEVGMEGIEDDDPLTFPRGTTQ